LYPPVPGIPAWHLGISYHPKEVDDHCENLIKTQKQVRCIELFFFNIKKEMTLHTSHKDMGFSVGLSPWTCDLKFLYVSNECRIGLLNLQTSLISMDEGT